MRGLVFLIVGLLLVTLGGCSLNALKSLRDQLDSFIYKAPNIEIQTVPEGPGESKVVCGQRVITRDKDGNIIKVEPLKN